MLDTFAFAALLTVVGAISARELTMPSAGWCYVQNGEGGALPILRLGHYATLQTPPIMTCAQTLVVDPSNDSIYTVAGRLLS